MATELIRVLGKNDSKKVLREELIENLKSWTKVNFIFNKGTVFYAVPEDENLSKLPDFFDKFDIKEWNELKNKRYYNTPLSHMMAVILKIGENLKVYEAEKAIEKFIGDETNS